MDGRSNLIFMACKVFAEMTILFLKDKDLSTGEFLTIFWASMLAIMVTFGVLMSMVSYICKLREKIQSHSEEQKMLFGPIKEGVLVVPEAMLEVKNDPGQEATDDSLLFVNDAASSIF